MMEIAEKLNPSVFHDVELIVQHYVYSAFGKIIAIKDKDGNDVTDAPPVDNFYTFTGREYDNESGLYYFRARMYDPALGRFLTEDPHSGELINPLTFISRYVALLNNPLINLDPTGKDVVPPKLSDIQNSFRMIAIFSPATYVMPFFQHGDYISNVFKNINSAGDFSGIGSSSAYNSFPQPLKYATLGIYAIINFKVLGGRIEKIFKKIF